VELHRRNGLHGLSALEPGRYAAAVLYYHRRSLFPSRLAALERYVQLGGSILGVHSATASFKQQDRYARLLGGSFDGHGPVQELRVRGEAAGDASGGPSFDDVPELFSVRDELYRHRFAAEVRIHFRAGDNEHSEVPAVWSRTEGRGKVFYSVFGHTAAALREPAVAGILRDGLEWLLQ
jgi:type 1 glutamine amidotransferase